MEKNIKNKQDAEIAIRYYLKGYKFTNKNKPYIITYAHAQTPEGTCNGAGEYTCYGMIEY